MFGITRCTNCQSLVDTHWLMNVLFCFCAFVGCLLGTIILINTLGLAALVPVLLIWIGAEVLREAVIPLEKKESRI